MESTERCQAITDGELVTFAHLVDLASLTPVPITWAVDGDQCSNAADYVTAGATGFRACRNHIADLLDHTAADWDGSIIAIRKLVAS